MFKAIQELINNPLIAFIGVILLWGLFYILFLRVFKLKEITWIRLEFSWIFVGVFGLLFLVAENRKNRSTNELELYSNYVKFNLSDLNIYSEIPNHCLKYNNSGVLPQNEFEIRQAEQDSVCSWMKRIHQITSKSIANDYNSLPDLPVLNITNYQTSSDYEYVLVYFNRINELTKKRDELRKIVNDTFWEGYKYTFGILFLIIAFAIRLTLVSKKIMDKKTK
ncbi:hypothetical protein [Wenyingzhuangia sp. IMCC45467]